MKNIVVRFIYVPGIVGNAIDFLTRSYFSHVEFGTPQGTWIGAHAPHGVQESPGDYCKPSRYEVFHLPVTDAQYDVIMKFVRAHIGVKYDYEAILGIALDLSQVHSSDRTICSAFVFVALSLVYRMLNVKLEYAYRVTPEMLHLSPEFCGRLVESVGC